MSNLLLDDYPLLVLPLLAVAIGLNEAIVTQQIHYWLKNIEKGRVRNEVEYNYHCHGGRVWVYNTISDWQEQFPFWCEETVRRILKKLKESGVLLTGNYNRLRYDQTKWYSLDYQKIDELVKTAVEKRKNSSQHLVGMENNKASGPLPHLVGMENNDRPGPIPETTPETSAETTTSALVVELKNFGVTEDGIKEITSDTCNALTIRQLIVYAKKQTPRPLGPGWLVAVTRDPSKRPPAELLAEQTGGGHAPIYAIAEDREEPLSPVAVAAIHEYGLGPAAVKAVIAAAKSNLGKEGYNA